MQKLDKIKPVKVGDQQTEVDPRSKTTADGAFNLLAKPEQVSVRGTKRMRSDKRKTAIVI